MAECWHHGAGASLSMSVSQSSGSLSGSSVSRVFPVVIYVQGNEQQTLTLNHTPYTVGRKVDRDLVIPDPRVSREHAQIVSENGEFFVVDVWKKDGNAWKLASRYVSKVTSVLPAEAPAKPSGKQ